MSREFQVEEHLSTHQLNNRSVSLCIPRLTRDRIHNSMYYKTNLTSVSLRGENLVDLLPTLINELGTFKNGTVPEVRLVGGVEFQCLLMRVVEIKPTYAQIQSLLDCLKWNRQFDDKYLLSLLLSYGRLQYYYLNEDTDTESARFWRNLYVESLNDYRKLRCIRFDRDCWSKSASITEDMVQLMHVDELVDWLTLKDRIWGISLPKCQWCQTLLEEDTSGSSSDSDNLAN